MDEPPRKIPRARWDERRGCYVFGQEFFIRNLAKTTSLSVQKARKFLAAYHDLLWRTLLQPGVAHLGPIARLEPSAFPVRRRSGLTVGVRLYARTSSMFRAAFEEGNADLIEALIVAAEEQDDRARDGEGEWYDPEDLEAADDDDEAELPEEQWYDDGDDDDDDDG